MVQVHPVTPVIGAEISGVDWTRPIDDDVQDAIYRALIDHLVIFIRGTDLTPEAHLEFAERFGEIDEPHQHYPSADGFERIVELHNDADNPPDTNSWHTDLTFKAEQPFASILVAREVPECGGDTLWSSCYAAYDRLPDGMKADLEDTNAIHDLGDFRNALANEDSAEARLNEAVGDFGHRIRSLVETHPITGRKYLNYNEAFVAHIVDKTTAGSNALKAFLADHMNRPEDQVRWRWAEGDLAMWDNRVTMHYAVADYLPHRRCMHRVTVVKDQRAHNHPD